MEEVYTFGDKGPMLYLVRETKSTTAASELRGIENQKKLCGKRHFAGALGVDYGAVTSADDLP
jgi:restriction endonuclease